MSNKNLLIVLAIILILQPIHSMGTWFSLSLMILGLLVLTFFWIKFDFRWKSKKKQNSQIESADQSVNTYQSDGATVSNRTILDLLKSYRHDWLNHLQVILGYVSLKKHEQIVFYIDKVNTLAKQRSLISSFANQELAVFLLMLPLHYPKLKIELDLTDGVEVIEKKIAGAWVQNYLKAYIDCFYFNLQESQQNFLAISLGAGDNQLIINFEFEGNAKDCYKDITRLAERLKSEGGKLLIDIYNEQELITELYFPSYEGS